MRTTVTVVKTSPPTVLADYQRLLHLSGYQKFLSREKITYLKINISWQKFFPACSTTPWQLEGVISTLLNDGYSRERIAAAQNRTVVVSARVGEIKNRQLPVLKKYDITNIHLYEPSVRWIRYHPRSNLLVLNKIFPQGICLPEIFLGSNIIHLPTMKTHVFTTITGAVKNTFGGLLSEKRHWTHSVIHETLVDLLQIQREVHSGIFAVMDATVAGDGAGPRAMRFHITNYLLASSDPVALDAVAAKMMGFDPLSLKFIRLANDKGLGCGDLKKIALEGDDISQVNFQFRQKDSLASKGQKLIYYGPLKPLEKILLREPVAIWAYLASRFYYDGLWYPLFGFWRVRNFWETEWGKLFLRYPE